MNARRSPGWILSNHTEDQGANLFAYTLPSSYLADSGDPRPIQTKSRSMPVHDGSRSDQDERLAPPGPAHSQRNPEQFVHGSQSMARSLRVQSQQLPTESQVFEGEVHPATERTDQPAEEMSERHNHGKNFSGNDRIKLCAKSFISQVYDLLARHTEQQRIEASGPNYLQSIIRLITETGLRVYKELLPMKKDQIDLENAVLWISDSNTPNGIGEVPLTAFAVETLRNQMAIAGEGHFLFPSHLNSTGHLKTLKCVWRKTLRRAGVPYFRIYDLRSTYATRLSAGGVADELVTQLLRQGDAKVFKKYSQMKLQMKREALFKLNRQANEAHMGSDTARVN